MATLRGFARLDLAHKTTFDELLRVHPPEISEFTFTNLYMWRHVYGTGWRLQSGTVIVACERLSVKGARVAIFPPIGHDPAGTLARFAGEAGAAGLAVEIHRAPPSLADALREEGLSFTIEPDRDNWDYVYRRGALATLDGSDLAWARKKVRRFERDNDGVYLPFTDEIAAACADMQDAWCHARQCDEDDQLREEDRAIEDMLRHRDVLRFEGGVLQVKGRVVAYTLGERLNSTTHVVHVEKADPAMFGAYQAINQHYAASLGDNVDLVNREQDLGEPGLRRAKGAYCPVTMVEKSKIILEKAST